MGKLIKIIAGIIIFLGVFGLGLMMGLTLIKRDKLEQNAPTFNAPRGVQVRRLNSAGEWCKAQAEKYQLLSTDSENEASFKITQLKQLEKQCGKFQESPDVIKEGWTNSSTPKYQVANLENFQVNPIGNNEYEVQNDARLLWPTAVNVEGYTSLEVIADTNSVACSPPDPCAGPSGQDGYARLSRVKPEQFPVGDAFAQALVGKFDNGPGFQIGSHRTVQIPAGAKEFKIMENIRIPYLNEASGGHKMRIILHGSGS